MGKTIETDIQIRFADVDLFQHVNNVNLQHFFDTGKMDFIKKTISGLMDWRGKTLILAHTDTDYFHQTRMDDRVYVETVIEKIGTKSVTYSQRLVNRDTGVVNARCRTVSVGFDFAAQESIDLLPQWRAVFEEYLIG